MSKKRIFDAVLLSLAIAYAITKAISNFQCSGDSSGLESIEDSWNDYFAGN